MTTPRRGPGPEAIFQTQVVEFAAWHHWRHYHPPDNRAIALAAGRTRKQRVVPGFPDLVLMRAPELIVVELKAEKGRLSVEQRDWLAGLALCGVETHVWRPSDWPAIEERLSRGSQAPAPLFAVRGGAAAA